MTLDNVTNIEGLFEAIQDCEGSVELVSEEGDKINLKSRLAQVMAVAGAFSHGYIRELELRVEKPKDMDKLLQFMLDENDGEIEAE